MQLFEIAEIANFSPVEQVAYEDSLKYYRDLNDVVDTSKQEGIEEGVIRVIVLLLEQRFGQLPADVRNDIQALDVKELEALAIAQAEFDSLAELKIWLTRRAV